MHSARRHAEPHKGPAIGGGDIKSDINVTPLVDVCLVLLIIFMVVTPLLQSGVPVQLPQTGKPAILSTGMATLGEIDEAVRAFRDAGGAELTLLKCTSAYPDPQKEVVIKADRRLKYRDVREVMKALNDAGFSKVGLITTKKGAS